MIVDCHGVGVPDGRGVAVTFGVAEARGVAVTFGVAEARGVTLGTGVGLTLVVGVSVGVLVGVDEGGSGVTVARTRSSASARHSSGTASSGKASSSFHERSDEGTLPIASKVRARQ